MIFIKQCIFTFKIRKVYKFITYQRVIDYILGNWSAIYFSEPLLYTLIFFGFL